MGAGSGRRAAGELGTSRSAGAAPSPALLVPATPKASQGLHPGVTQLRPRGRRGQGGCRRSPAPPARCWWLSKALPAGGSAFLDTKPNSSQQGWEQPVPGTALGRGEARGEAGSGTASLLAVFFPQNPSLFEARRGNAATPGWADPSGAPGAAVPCSETCWRWCCRCLVRVCSLPRLNNHPGVIRSCRKS